jgi:hypothetical protein
VKGGTAMKTNSSLASCCPFSTEEIANAWRIVA